MAPKKAPVGPTLKVLTTKYKELKAALTDIFKFVETYKPDATASQVSVRLDNLNKLWDVVCDTLVAIKSHDDYEDQNDAAYNKEREEMSKNYYDAKSFLMDKAREFQDNSSESTHNDTFVGGVEHVRLPQIKLQTFNGNIDDWLSFRDLYLSLIHWKTDLPDVEKFHYLRGCLEEKPRTIVDGLKITASNYKLAWDRLQKHYNNSKVLKRRLVQSLFTLPTLSKESSTDLHDLVDEFERILNTLDQVVSTTDYKDLLLVNLLVARLDPVTRRAWEEVSAANESVTVTDSADSARDSLKDLCDFLNQRIRVLESLPTKSTDSRAVQQHHQQQYIPKPKVKKTSFSSVRHFGSSCVACKQNHLLFQSTAFQQLSVSDRDDLIKHHDICRNCFRTGHQAKNCESKYRCRNCKGRHHTLICFQHHPEGENSVKVTAAKGNNSSNSNDIQGQNGPTTSHVANMAATGVSLSGAATQGIPSAVGYSVGHR